MPKRIFGSLSALILLIGVAPAVWAGNIISIGTPDGPGGSGSAVIDSQIHSAADVILNFTSVAPISFTLVTDGPNAGLIHTSSAPGTPQVGMILNNTGVPWTSLLFHVSGPNAHAAAIGHHIPDYFAKGTFRNRYILLDHGTVPAGAQYEIDLGFISTQAGEFTVTYTPNATIPEPSSLILLGTAFVGVPIVYWRRRRSRGATAATGR
jgi:hypothetical protein